MVPFVTWGILVATRYREYTGDHKILFMCVVPFDTGNILVTTKSYSCVLYLLIQGIYW